MSWQKARKAWSYRVHTVFRPRQAFIPWSSPQFLAGSLAIWALRAPWVVSGTDDRFHSCSCSCPPARLVTLYVFLRALGSQIALTELLAPSPTASGGWGLKHAVPPVDGPAELSSARSLGCTPHPRDTGLAPQCWWPRPPPTVLGLLTPWVSLGRAAQSWAPLPVEIKAGAGRCRDGRIHAA